jgi:poly-gamma-glutamate synthesis protein (capsule biosynthesis protein)
VKSYDIALVNVETPIAGDEFKYDGYPNFNTPKENAFALMDIGFNIINTANNHMLDKWEKGYQNSIEFWSRQKNAFEIGSFRNKEDFETLRVYKKDGVSIAFLSYTYSTNGMTLPAGSTMVIPYIDHATIERQVKAARPLADLLFVVMHWGDEDSFTPNQQQRTLAQMMVDNDVDVILGMHPHVFQETKWVTRPNGKKTLITYSIGNMISGMLGAKNMIGGFLCFDIVKTNQNGISETAIENVEMIPIITHYNMKRKGFQIYRFEDYTEELAKAHGNINSDNRFSYKYIKDLIVQNVAPEFLSDFYK